MTLVLILMSIVSCSNDDSNNETELPVESNTYFTHRDIMYIIDEVEFRDRTYEESILKKFNIDIEIHEYFGINDEANEVLEGTVWFNDILSMDGSMEGTYTIADPLKQPVAGEIQELSIDIVIGGEKSKLYIHEGTLTIEIVSEDKSKDATEGTYLLTFEGKDHVGKEIKLYYKGYGWYW